MTAASATPTLNYSSSVSIFAFMALLALNASMSLHSQGSTLFVPFQLIPYALILFKNVALKNI